MYVYVYEFNIHYYENFIRKCKSITIHQKHGNPYMSSCEPISNIFSAKDIMSKITSSPNDNTISYITY